MDDAEGSEKVARALCLADDLDPDQEIPDARADAFLTPRLEEGEVAESYIGPRWQTYAK
jgi:hypothetical protein